MSTITYRGLWRWHFHAGLLCIPFVLILAITGSIFLFKPQIDALADRDVDTLTLSGPRASGEQHIAAALASTPGSKLFVYEVPREADDAVRVHIYAPDDSGSIVYVHPHSLAVLKSVPHTSRLTEIVRKIHSELLVGRTGSLLIELAASWAIIMLGTGLFLWWPRDTRGLAGVIYPRFAQGKRVFWRDLHAVTGIWVSLLAMFLLITALPWTTVAGEGIGKIRGWVAPAPRDWSTSGADEHAAHRAPPGAAAVTTSLSVDQVIARIAPLRLESPVRLYLPNEANRTGGCARKPRIVPRCANWRWIRSPATLLHEDRFADKSALDKAIHVGIAAHEGQLFGWPNQVLGLCTALGLITICVSAIVMWWRRRPEGSLGVPADRVPDFQIGSALKAGIVVLGIALPMLGISIVVLWILGFATRRLGDARA